MDQDVEAIYATCPAGLCGTQERSAVMTVDEIHHGYPIVQFIGRNGDRLEEFGSLPWCGACMCMAHAKRCGIDKQVDGGC